MSIGKAIKKPERAYLVNIESNASMECMLNPSKLTESIRVNWTRPAVPGLPFQVLQYQSTGNRKVDKLEFYLNRILASEQDENAGDILAFRDFIKTLTVPSVAGGSPPRVLVVWPNVLTMEAVVTEVEFQYQLFAVDGSALVYTAVCSFEEAPVIRVIEG
ncbi:MAG: peptidoglycan-binding protein [Deltaproteobacteria bacterium]|nr:peptidoglycan-binding protein [Deltaproteobacteria bacterium]